MPLTSETLLLGHVSEETALVLDDYPYGFRLRTSIRYWLETTKHGDRFVSQTLNPKTDRWNKPKKSTYCDVGAMFRDEVGHITWTGFSIHADPQAFDAFMAIVGAHLSDTQKNHAACIRGVAKAFEGVTYSIHEGDETDEDRARQAGIQAELARRAAIATREARQAL